MKKYDYLVVGAGISGATAARLLADKGFKVLVIEKDKEVGGNCKTIRKNGIIIHVDGPHIFHTSDEEVWQFVNRFSSFDKFVNQPQALYHGCYYSLPFNLNTFEEIFGTDDVDKIKKIIDSEIKKANISNPPKNLEEQAISMVGTTIYEKLVKHYTEKQWGKPCKELSPDIIKRLPLRWERNNNYFNDKYQGIPTFGYTIMIENIVSGHNIDVKLNVKSKDLMKYMKLADKVIYTGRLDKLIKTSQTLPWRSLRFKTIWVPVDKKTVLPSAVVNCTDETFKNTRITEHKQFMNTWPNDSTTALTYEYPCKFSELGKMKPYYPINNSHTEELANQFRRLIKEYMPNVYLLGRLARYKYLDMDDAVREAMDLVKELTK